MRGYKIIAYLSALSYVFMGGITILSVINTPSTLRMNFIVGLFFIALGCYLFYKTKSVFKLISTIERLKMEKDFSLKTTRFMFFEYVFIVIALVLGVVLLSGVIFRAFIEKLPIFG